MFSQALLEKVENLQRQLHCAEKKLLSKELESEERVRNLFVVFLQSLLFHSFQQAFAACCHHCITLFFFYFAFSLLHHSLQILLDHAAFSVALKTRPLTPLFFPALSLHVAIPSLLIYYSELVLQGATK